ncbi:MAG: polyprenyl synthetase family protein [Planctomycetota bacterium]|nr:polyprenyl synthetase family protein [Planctomycetota bacterium]
MSEPDVFLPLPAIEAFLTQTLSAFAWPANLFDATSYATLGGGKRLRPILAWHCAVAACGRGEPSLLPGAAVELVHAFSLVHDDLPGLDNDDLRRGKPTLHKHAGEAMAILAGDALLAGAFEILVSRCEDPALGVALARELASGTTAMIAGQVYDTVGGVPEGLSDREHLAIIHRNKTGALIRAACRMGTLAAFHEREARAGAGEPVGGAPRTSRDEALRAISTYADAVGLVFQIVDDLLDVEQSSEHAGKRTGKDAEAGKRTYPSVLGVQASREEVERLTHRAIDAVRAAFGPDAQGLERLASLMSRRTK